MKTGSGRARYSTFIFMCFLCLSAASAFAHDPTLDELAKWRTAPNP
jgi:hypothetical protein